MQASALSDSAVAFSTLLYRMYIHVYMTTLFKQVCILCLVFLDGAHVARMKARADAEFYTAVKLAEANKVPSCGMKFP